MRSRTLCVHIIAAVMIAACNSSSAPRQMGALDSRITQGEYQTTKAGASVPQLVVDQVFRNPITGSITSRPSIWERLILPPIAHALQSVGVQVQPNSVVCVSEDQTILVPKVRCVNSDSEGNTRFDFLQTTKAGTHEAHIQATYGTETTIPDTVTIDVAPDVFAKSPLQSGTSWPGRTTPAEFPAEVAQDQYDNAVPYRLQVQEAAYAQLRDTLGRLVIRGGIRIYARTLNDSLGSAGARTIVIDSVIGPEAIEGMTVDRIRTLANVITDRGIGVVGVLVTSKAPNADGSRFVGLHAQTCAISSNSCAY